MGFFPCSAHGAMFKGAAEAAYPALVFANESERTHLRFCHECFTSFLATCEERLEEVVDGAKPQSADKRLCCMCGGAAGRTALFVTAYPRGAEPRQFFGHVCDSDVAPARADWLRPEVA